MQSEKVFLNVTVKATRTRFDYKGGESNIEIVALESDLEKLNLGSVVESQLAVALSDLKEFEEEEKADDNKE